MSARTTCAVRSSARTSVPTMRDKWCEHARSCSGCGHRYRPLDGYRVGRDAGVRLQPQHVPAPARMRAPRTASASWDWTARHLLLAVGGRPKAVSLVVGVVKDDVDLKAPVE